MAAPRSSDVGLCGYTPPPGRIISTIPAALARVGRRGGEPSAETEAVGGLARVPPQGLMYVTTMMEVCRAAPPVIFCRLRRHIDGEPEIRRRRVGAHARM